MPDPQSLELGRLHLVFVPGFGGFDALGDIEYYAGITDVFQAWCAQRHAQHYWGNRVVVHYFDNLPTAGVTTRAQLLREYLTSRARRHEFRLGADRIALIAHSTGCLDARQLLVDLHALRGHPTSRRGVEAKSREHFEGEELLELISRVVFLSAPNRGSNIADWVQRLPVSARALVLTLVSSLADGLDFPGLIVTREKLPWLLDAFSGLLLSGLRGVGGPSGVLQAFEDLGREVSKIRDADPWVAANSRIALAKLQLYLDQAEADFLAIDDLAVQVPDNATPYASDLARASEHERDAELARWRAAGIAVRSYATRGRTPFAAAPGAPHKLAPHRRVLRSLYPRKGDPPGTDAPYRMGYAACATGPFRLVERHATHFVSGQRESISASDNDGIVNTGSMLWPSGDETLLVDADHGDIIGHFEEGFAEGMQAQLRRRVRYDIFASRSGFDRQLFEAVWFDIFSFCAGAPPAARRMR
jgi:triacylglycerol lipase